MLPQEQKLLLEIIFSKKDKSFTWGQWQEKYSLENISSAAYYLLPAVYKALETENNLDLKKLSGIYTRNFANIEYKLRHALPVIQTFEQSNINTTLIDTCAVALSSGLNFSSFLFDEITVLISEQEIPRAIEILKQLGWGTNITKLNQDFIKHRSFLPFWKSTGGKIILSWNSFYPRPNICLNNSISSNRHKITFKDAQIFAASIEDLFLHSLLHGPENRLSYSSWILNALTLAKLANWNFNWDKLEELAKKSENLRSYYFSLKFLKDEMEISEIPKNLLIEKKPSLAEIIAIKICRKDSPKAATGITHLIGGVLYKCNGLSFFHELIPHLKENLQIAENRELFLFLLKRIAFKLKNSLKLD